MMQKINRKRGAARRASSLIIRTIVLVLATSPLEAGAWQPGAPSAGALGPVGGGVGYTDLVDPANAQVVVHTASELVAAIANALPGDLIYVDDSADIELRSPSQVDLRLPPGATLASGRGRAGSVGALVSVPDMYTVGPNRPLIRLTGNGGRVTGIRVRGPLPHLTTGGDGYVQRDAAAIRIEADGARIDNCEIFGWTHGVRVQGVQDAVVEYSYIHHDLYFGTGYGVSSVNDSGTTIQYNVFNANRHSIAGTGDAGQSYVARFNWFGPVATSHAVDVHGGCDRNDGTVLAGRRFDIYYNSISMDADCAPSVKIRGIPSDLALVTSNRFVAPSEASAIVQTKVVLATCGSQSTFINVVTGANQFGQDVCTTAPPGVCNLAPALTRVAFTGTGSWSEYGNTGEWRKGDFNGDGLADLLRESSPGFGAEVLISSGSAFYPPALWSSAAAGDRGWQVGDFNGDGRSDLLQYRGGDGVYVLLSTGAMFSNPVRWTGFGDRGRFWIGDFDGDGRDDLLRTQNSAGGAEVLRSTGSAFSVPEEWSNAGDGDLSWFVGDFDGDGRADLLRHIENSTLNVNVGGQQVLRSTGTSFGAAQQWGYLRLTATECVGLELLDPVDSIFVGDFDRSGSADLLTYTVGVGSQVFLSNGSDAFEYDGRWTGAGYGDQGWYLGDFNGDGRDDLLRSRTGISEAEVYLSTRDSAFTIRCPEISQQPTSASACPSGVATFSVAATGADPITFQWQVMIAPNTWQNVGTAALLLPCGGTVFASAPTAATTQIGITPCPGVDAYQVRCIASNSCSGVASDPAVYAICYANCDCSNTAPALNALDFGCFLSKFAAGDSYANCDNSSIAPLLNALDFGCFLAKFAAGCS